MGSGGTLHTLGQKVRRRLDIGLVSRTTRYGLLRDLSVPHEHPSATIAIHVRPMRPDDVDALYEDGPTTTAEQNEVRWRQRYVDQQLAHGWVAVDDATGRPCYVQWLLPRSENAFLTATGDFPPLEPGTALLENAFTPLAYRGLRIMSAAMSRIAEQATLLDARQVLTFVADDNAASLKGCSRAGFELHLVQHRTRRALGLLDSSVYELLAPDDPRRDQWRP